MNNKAQGSIANLIVFIVSAFALVIVLGLLSYGTLTIADKFGELDQNLNGANLSEITDNTTDNLGTISRSGVQLFAFMVIFGMVLFILISNIFTDAMPVFFVFNIFITVIAVIVSIPISNAYETVLSQSGALSTHLATFSMSNTVILYLPLWVAAIGVLGGILLFIRINLVTDSV